MHQNKNGVDYIINSKRPYPEWLKTHTVFKEMVKIDKVFPKIGLPNFKEPVEIVNTQEATTEATRLGNRIKAELSSGLQNLYQVLDRELVSAAQDRNEKCAKIQNTINLMGVLVRSLQYNDYVKVVSNKVNLSLREDIFGFEKGPVFRKNESLIRIMNKIIEMCEEHGIVLSKTDQYQEFKDFSRVNVPSKQYMVVFSSSGEDGAWDIGTISMRGVTSCQSWNAPQSRGLIGSISSKFTGVIYLASEQEVPGYGSKMLNRSMVRFAISNATRQPALIIDRMYPNHNEDTYRSFKKVLKDKSGLPVFCTVGGNGDVVMATDYYIPDETSRRHLKQGEFSYMDYAIPVKTHNVPAVKKTNKDFDSLIVSFKKKVTADLSAGTIAKRDLFLNAEKAVEPLRLAYDEAKKKWDEEKDAKPENERGKFQMERPRMDPELVAFGKGGVTNFFTHCDKKHGANSAGTLFAKLILDSVIVEDNLSSSKEESYRKYLMAFLKNPAKAKEEARKNFVLGTWMRSFPKSAERYFDYAFSQMKPYFIAACKDLIKNSN